MTCPVCGSSLGAAWMWKPSFTGSHRCPRCSTGLKVRYTSRWVVVLLTVAILAGAGLGIVAAHLLGLEGREDSRGREPGAIVGGVIGVLLAAVICSPVIRRYAEAVPVYSR